MKTGMYLHLLLLLNTWFIVEMLPVQNLFYKYYFGIFSAELIEMVLLPYSGWRSTRYSNWLDNLSASIRIGYKDVFFNGFFPSFN